MTLKSKNKSVRNILISLITISIFSCKDPKNIPIPNVEQIKNNLTGKKISTWIFYDSKEIDTVNIYDSQIFDNNLELKVKMDIYVSRSWGRSELRKFDGKIIYEVVDNNWKFKEINGIVKDDNDNSININPSMSICVWCGKEINGRIWGLSSDENIDDYRLIGGDKYHQNCAVEYREKYN